MAFMRYCRGIIDRPAEPFRYFGAPRQCREMGCKDRVAPHRVRSSSKRRAARRIPRGVSRGGYKPVESPRRLCAVPFYFHRRELVTRGNTPSRPSASIAAWRIRASFEPAAASICLRTSGEERPRHRPVVPTVPSDPRASGRYPGSSILDRPCKGNRRSGQERPLCFAKRRAEVLKGLHQDPSSRQTAAAGQEDTLAPFATCGLIGGMPAA